jgi:hypothetical protein
MSRALVIPVYSISHCYRNIKKKSEATWIDGFWNNLNGKKAADFWVMRYWRGLFDTSPRGQRLEWVRVTLLTVVLERTLFSGLNIVSLAIEAMPGKRRRLLLRSVVPS